jgi:Tol biopolymer transport system component
VIVSLVSPTRVPFLKTAFNEASPAVSPDGRLVAYTSNENFDRTEVYVSASDGSARRLVSRNGGTAPKWARSGRALFFRGVASGGGGSDTLFSARIDFGSEITVSPPTVAMTGLSAGGGYGVLPGDTLIVTRPSTSSAVRPVIVVMNFARELERLLPPR